MQAQRMRSLVAIVLMLALPIGVRAASEARPLVLEHLTTADGLPQGDVTATLQDSQGFVWLGTEDGLVRYDGHDLHRYAHTQSPEGLPGNYIYQFVEDARHDLWIAVKDAGLARWDRATDKFTVYAHQAGNPASLASDAVRMVLVDARGRIWIGMSDAGVDVLDPATGHIDHHRHDPADPASLASDQVFTLALDRAANLWVGTDSGLDELRSAARGFAHVLRGRQISRVLEDQAGALWVGSYDGGLERLDSSGRVLESFRHDAQRSGSLASDDVRAVLEDQAGRLWVGTADGLDLLERSSRQFTHYRHDRSEVASLRDSFIMSLYQDETGLVWIGTRNGGVSRWNPHSWELGAHRPEWLGDKVVTAFADAPDNRVWVGSLGGLTRLDADTGASADIDTLVGRANALGDDRVMSLHQDRRGTLWIGTLAGLKRLDRDGTLQAIPTRPGDSRALSAPGVMSILEASSGQLWLGTFGGGLNVLDAASGQVRQLPVGAGPGAVSGDIVTAVAEDAHGNLWIGTDGAGLDLARADGVVVRVFRHDARDAGSLPSNTVYAITVDAHGRIWVATDGGGLALVEGSAAAPHSIRFHVVARAHDTLYGVLADAAGRIWVSGNSGLTRYDPESRLIKTYHREHGLQGEEFSSGAFHRLRDGRLCFGGPNGFNIFDPARLTENRQPPRVALTGMEVLGVPAPSGTSYWLLDHIELDHRANIVSLDFSVLDFTSPRRNRLAYRMQGLTDRWIEVGAQHRVTLTNLEAGDHVLEVRAANADSAWTEQPLRLRLHRDPAPWRSPWAYAGYALAALLLVAYRVRLQRTKFRRMAEARQRLESEVELRTRELTESNRKLADAVRAKSSFLDRMSHELRTPMNGVVGMTELLSRTTLSATQARLTQTIRSSAEILLQIVNDLLDLSKIQAGKVRLEELPLELTPLLEECTSLFTASAQSKGIELTVCPPSGAAPALRGDSLRVRQILLNLIGNAVKFTAQGEVVVGAEVVRVEAETALVRFTVADTGIGMDEATISRIFEPFTQADESTTRRYGGSGLGLAICRELVEFMGGAISVESRPQAGSSFHVSLPLRLGAELPATTAPLPARSVRILTRRQALATALGRYAQSFGLAVIEERAAPGSILGPDTEVTIIDAGSHADRVAALVRPGARERRPVVVVASAAESEAHGLAGCLDPRLIVAKPVHGQELREALAAALGLVPAAAREVAAPTAEVLGAHVLLVEDEPVNAAVAEGYLAALGCTTVWVRDGAEAVARQAAERFDLILMDLSMPGMDGFATTALIRERDGGREVPIVALSAHDAASYRASCLAAGMDEMLSKPYTLGQLAPLLRRVLRRPAGDAIQQPASTPRVDSESDSLASIDASVVAALRALRPDGRDDLYARVVELFRTGSTECLEQLHAALQAGDSVAAAALCHRLAASAANVGALVFAKDVRRLEQLCAGNGLASAAQLFTRLRAAHPPLLAGLTRHTLKATA